MRGWLYDLMAAPVTTSWYAAALDRVAAGARLLDVGIGTGRSLVAHADRVRERKLRVTGLDIDETYVRRCRRLIARAGMDDLVSVKLESFLEHEGGPYDVICFSASFMLLPDPERALERARTLLASGGRLMFTQTFETRPSRLVEWLKPRLRWLTTIDFGRVTYEQEFRATLERAGINLEEMVVLSEGRRRSFRLAVARPRPRD
jgi:SAM-dependent methyltransferase